VILVASDEGDEMGTVMIECPETKKPLSTGISMNQGVFAASTLTNNSVQSHCGKMHKWDKKDAWVQ
jgi:hypothetical protein